MNSFESVVVYFESVPILASTKTPSIHTKTVTKIETETSLVFETYANQEETRKTLHLKEAQSIKQTKTTQSHPLFKTVVHIKPAKNLEFGEFLDYSKRHQLAIAERGEDAMLKKLHVHEAFFPVISKMLPSVPILSADSHFIALYTYTTQRGIVWVDTEEEEENQTKKKRKGCIIL